MRDSYEDVYDEQNNQIHWDIWNSPDIWTRNSAGTTNTEHENPEYRANTDNYVNFRIRNIGCTTNSNIGQAVRLYWTMSSAMEDWDQDWKNAVAGGLDVGDEITEAPFTPNGNGIIIPTIQPGSEMPFFFPWRVKEPRAYPDFDPFLKKIDVCLLARMESGTGAAPYSAPYGMTITEVKDLPTFQNSIKTNVRNNNDIITRNLIVTDLVNGLIPGPGGHQVQHYALVANRTASVMQFDIQFEDVLKSNLLNINDFVDFSVDLGEELYNRWSVTGKKGSGFALIPNSTSIRLTDRYGFTLKNISLNPNEKRPIEFNFNLRGTVTDRDTKVFKHTLSQFVSGGTDKLGAVNFITNVKAGTPPQPQENPQQGGEEVKIKPIDNIPATQPDLFEQAITVYPNPTNQNITLFTWFEQSVNVKAELRDITGRLILSEPSENVNGSYQKTFDLSNLSSGVYLINVIMNDRILVKKFVRQ